MNDEQQAHAIIYGLALGDALGWPIEFLKMNKIGIIYGESGIKEPPNPAAFTDETQMSMVIAESLIEAGESDIDGLMKVVTRRMIEWSNSPKNDRAPGHTVTEAIRTLEAGVSWKESGPAHAKGNGCAVRVAPIGYLYQNDPDRLIKVAQATGVATHAHPTAQAAVCAAAYLIKLALDGLPPQAYVERTLAKIGGLSSEFDAILRQVDNVVQWTDEFAALETLGSGWNAEEAVAMAIYCAVRYEDDYVGAVRRAVNIPGDSDSVGSLTGGLVAARVGLSAVPQMWIERLEDLKGLTDLAVRLAEKKANLARPVQPG
jgi:ADP-ribosylglycohydrolase